MSPTPHVMRSTSENKGNRKERTTRRLTSSNTYIQCFVFMPGRLISHISSILRASLFAIYAVQKVSDKITQNGYRRQNSGDKRIPMMQGFRKRQKGAAYIIQLVSLIMK